MIFLTCLGLTCVSTLIVNIKNNAANNKIERSGYTIISDPRSFSEKAISFIKDYTYLLVPILNIYRAGRLFLKPDVKYAKERQALLEERERIVKSSEVVKEVPKKKVAKKIVPKILQEKTPDEMSLEEKRDYYIRLDKKLHEQLAQLDSHGCSDQEHNAVVDKIIEVQGKYKVVQRQIELNSLKSIRSDLLEQNDEMKLVL